MAVFKKVKTTTGPISMVKNISLKGSLLCLPRNSARNLLPDVPKKFVTNIVITRQKLIAIFTVPKVSLPNVLATKILKMNGTKPTKQSAAPVYNEFLNKRLFSIVHLINLYHTFSDGLRPSTNISFNSNQSLFENKEIGMAIIKPPRRESITMSVRLGFAFFTAGSAVSNILMSKFSFASSILAISYC